MKQLPLYSYGSWDSIKNDVDPSKIHYSSHVPPINETLNWENFDGYMYDYSTRDSNSIVTYRINKLFFRAAPFTNLVKGASTALYSGCSFTYGVGIPEEYLWTTVLTKKFKIEQQFNLGVSGGSIFLTIKNLMSFIRLYGKPKYIFVVFPPIARDLRYDTKKKKFYSVLRGGAYFEGGYPKAFLEYAQDGKYEDDIMKAITEIKLFEDYCNAAGISLYWTYWYQPDEKAYKEFKFDNIIYMDPDFKMFADENGYYPNPENLPFWELAQDGAHSGTCWHRHVASRFYDKVLS